MPNETLDESIAEQDREHASHGREEKDPIDVLLVRSADPVTHQEERAREGAQDGADDEAEQLVRQRVPGQASQNSSVANAAGTSPNTCEPLLPQQYGK
jgi:hypothetical protein